MSNCHFNSTPAFTIVELLIVIVVIGILAAITIVSYTGISSKATVASLQSDLDSSSRLLKMYQVEKSAFPSTVSTDCVAQPDTTTNKCLKSSNGNTYEYYVDNTSNKQTYCITATKNNYSYSINETGAAVPAAYCPVLYLDSGNNDSYDGVGTVWKDLSGNGNNAVLAGGASYDSSNGGSIAFDGINGSAIVNSFKSNITNPFSVSAWMKFNKYAYMQPLFMSNMFAFKWRISGQNTYWNIFNSVAFDNSIAYPSAPNINEWHYYTFTYDGSIEKIYLDSMPKTQYSKTISLALPTRLDIAPSSGEVVDGFISNVSVYNSALSTTEILQTFNTLKGRYGL